MARKQTLPRGIYKRGNIYWLAYTVNGHTKRVSTKSYTLKGAEKFKRTIERQIEDGVLGRKGDAKFTIQDMMQLIADDYIKNKRKSTSFAVKTAEEIYKFFESKNLKLVANIGVEDIEDYKRWVRKEFRELHKEEIKPATMNRKLSLLKRAYRIAYNREQINRIPFIEMEDESKNVRQGFMTYGQYLDLHEELPKYLKPVLTFGFHTGWRRAEILGMVWAQVDIMEGWVGLEAFKSKNQQSRIVYFDEDMKKMFIKLRQEAIKRRERREGKKCKDPADDDLVFVNPKGLRIRELKEDWDKASYESGVLNRSYNRPFIFHDLRRSFARAALMSGMTEKQVMLIAGWRSRKTLDRYNIVSPDDMKQAIVMMRKKLRDHEAYLRKENNKINSS